MKLLPPSILIGTLLLVSGCNPTTTNTALKALGAFTDGLDLFEKAAKYFGEEVEEATSEANQKFSKHGEERWFRDPYQVDLPAVARQWESDWEDVSERTDELNDALEKLGDLGDSYFAALEDISKGIDDPELRRKELQKNKELHKEWNRIYSEATNRVDRAKKLLKEGNDFHRVLVGSAMRMKLGKHIETLKMISAEADQLVTQIESLSSEARGLSSK